MRNCEALEQRHCQLLYNIYENTFLSVHGFLIGAYQATMRLWLYEPLHYILLCRRKLRE